MDIYVATALTVYGIETYGETVEGIIKDAVATALTVYGIETEKLTTSAHKATDRLQQRLPFTVLKPIGFLNILTN